MRPSWKALWLGLLIPALCLSAGLALAFSDPPIDTTKPANTDPLSQGAAQIRALKTYLVDTLGFNISANQTATAAAVATNGVINFPSGVGNTTTGNPITGLALLNGASTVTGYGGVTCTNQTLTALSASGAGTCTTLTSSYVNTTIIHTGSASLGGLTTGLLLNTVTSSTGALTAFGGSTCGTTQLAVGQTASGVASCATVNATYADDSVVKTSAIPVCLDTGGNHLNYNTSSGAWSCGTTAGSSTAQVFGRVVRTGGDLTTTSTTFVDLTGATVTFTTGAFPVAMGATGIVYNDQVNGDTHMDFDVDGTRIGGTNGLVQWRGQLANAVSSLSPTAQTAALTSASHTVKTQWRVASGTTTMFSSSMAPSVLWAHEIR